MNAVDLFMWIVIGGAISLVFIMFLWSISAMAKLVMLGRKIIKRKPKRRRKAAGRKQTTKGSRRVSNCRWQQSERR